MALKSVTKIRLLEAADIFKAVGIAVLLILSIKTLQGQSKQINATNQQVVATRTIVEQIKQETQELKMDNHNDHDTLLKALDCMAELFGEHPNEFIPRSEFDACLKGTRIASFPTKPTNSPIIPSGSIPKSTTVATKSNQPTISSTEPDKRLKVLGVPVCVPFTKLCVTK